MKYNTDGTESGNILSLFENTNKRIMSTQDHDDMVQTETLRANNSSGNSKP